jgi:hypothetical protein
MHVSVDEHKIEIDITNILNELNEWVERIGKTVMRFLTVNNLQVLS